MRLFKVMIISILLFLSLVACDNGMRRMEDIEFVGIKGSYIEFVKDDGTVMLFEGELDATRFAIVGQRYTVVYYFNHALYSNYRIRNIILNEDAKH